MFSDENVQVELALTVAELRMHLAGLGVDQPGLQHLTVAGEQCVGQRAVAPEHPMAVQLHQQTGHRVEQPGAVFGLIGR